MQFEEMKKIWTAQNDQPMYAFNEASLHRHIVSKRNTGFHITNISELLCIVVYTVAACIVIITNHASPGGKLFMYCLGGWMLLSALYILVSRIRRINGNHRFDRSMQGDLQHAVSVAAYQVRFSWLMRWNILPIGLLVVASFMENGKAWWFSAGLLLFFALTFYFSGWEHNIYKKRKKELLQLQHTLESDGGNE